MPGSYRSAALASQVDQVEARHLRDLGRVEDARSLLERAAERMAPIEEGRQRLVGVLLDLDLIELEIHAGDLDGAQVLLDGVEEHLRPGAEFPMHAGARGFYYGLRVEHALRSGLPDEATPWLERERDFAWEQEGSPRLRTAWALHRCAWLLALEEHEQLIEEVRDFLGAEEVEPRWEAALEVRIGIALARLERADPAREPRAADLLASTLRRELLPPQHALAAELALGKHLMAVGRVEGAEPWLSAARRRVETWQGDVWVELATLAALEVRHAISGGAPRALLEARARELELRAEEFLGRWSALTRRRGGRGVLHYGSRQTILAARIEAELALAEEGSLERAAAVAIDALGRGQLAGRLDPSAGDGSPDLDFARSELLPADGGLLLFLPAPQRSHLFALDAAECTHHDLPGVARLDLLRYGLIEALQRDLATGDEASAASVAAAGAELAGALLPEALQARLASWEGLLVVGLETLGYVPFGALRAGAGGWLGEAHPITHLPSLHLGRALANRRETAAPRALDLLLYAAPSWGPDDRSAPLRWGAAEEEEVAGAYPAERRRVRSGGGAARETLVSEALGDYAVLQVLSHGDYDSADERPPRLLLASSGDGEGVFDCDDLEDLEAPPLVILSTCGGGRAPLRRGDDGGSHMGGAALVAGAQAVLLSKLDLGYGATRRISGHLHRALSRGRSPAQALWQARREMAEESPSSRFLLHVVGLGFDPVPVAVAEQGTSGTDPQALLIIVFVVGLGAAFWVIRGRRRAS